MKADQTNSQRSQPESARLGMSSWQQIVQQQNDTIGRLVSSVERLATAMEALSNGICSVSDDVDSIEQRLGRLEDLVERQERRHDAMVAMGTR